MDKASKARRGPPLAGLRLLVVEDDVLLLMELETILLDAGAEKVHPCRTMTAALAGAKKPELSAAILDVRLGRDTAAAVARQLHRRGIPFMFYTGQVAGDPDLAEWSNCKIVSKPASATAIVAALSALVDSSSSRWERGFSRSEAAWRED